MTDPGKSVLLAQGHGDIAELGRLRVQGGQEVATEPLEATAVALQRAERKEISRHVITGTKRGNDDAVKQS